MYNKIWDMLFKHVGSYELKEAITWQAMRSIEKKDINILYMPVSTFNPNYPEDGLTDYSAEFVTRFVKETGVEDFVKECLAA